MTGRLSRGLTLLELIIAITLGVLVLQMVVSISIVFNKTWAEQFNKTKINNEFITISERITRQLPGLASYTQLSKKNIPYAEDLLIEPVPGNNKIFKTTLEKMINKTKYTYFSYFKVGAY